MTSPDHERRHIRILDWMRGVAAVLVCASHLRNAMIVDWANARNHGIINKVLYGITGFGHQSVIVFFVLSGYLVGGSVIAAGPHFRWSNYFIARLVRLWVVLVPCLVITSVADSFTASRANDVLTGEYAARWHSAPTADHYSNSWQTLVGNLAFVQTIRVPVYGSNGPLWSLANEFWYYVMFPLLMTAIGKLGVKSKVSKYTSFALLAIIIHWIPAAVISGFFVWLFGCIVSYVRFWMPRSIKWRRAIFLSSILSFVIALGLSKVSSMPAWFTPWGDFTLGATFAAFLLCALNGLRQGEAAQKDFDVSRWLSDISFSLYLSHFPLVMLFSAYNFYDESLQPVTTAWIKFFGVLGGLIAIARFVWWLFERHTPLVKKFFVAGVARIY